MRAPLAVLVLQLWAAIGTAATLPAGFSEIGVSGLSSATAFAIANDGRIFVCEQEGALRVIKNFQLLPTPFVTVTVDSQGERGLLGVAFDPDFDQNQYIYIYYTSPTPILHNRVSRFTAGGDVAVPGSEVFIFELDPLSSATNHNGGAIHFGPDGKLYIAVGENANGANAQTLSNLHGKMLRINADGSIPTDNPFYGTATNEERSIWALGLRNPFTFAFQPGTGRMFINDVGQNTWEEINDGIAGSNYGWPATEGPTTNPDYRSPLYWYGHGAGSTTGCAITGGAFYNPQTIQFPGSYLNRYFFADYCSGWIRLFNPADSTASGFATGISSPVDLHVSTDGSLYYLARGSGSLHRVVYTENAVPKITQQPSDVTVAPGQSATFTIAASGAPPLSYQWQRNGVDIPGATGTSYTLANAASTDNGARYRCIVTNPFGNATSDEAILTVLPPAQRTFVSAATGNDANSCSRSAPCRQFAEAISRTAAGGEIVVLDSGGYGRLTIGQSVALISPAGVHAAITAFSGNAITVSGGASDVVILRGLYLNSLGGANGIHFQGGQALHVENCVLSGFGGSGVLAAVGNVYVNNTIARQNGDGFQFSTNTGTIHASLHSVRAEDNLNYGVAASTNSVVTVTRAVAAGNGGGGFYAGESGVINLESCSATLNFYGVYAANGTARVASSMITGNTIGVGNGVGGTTLSFGDNRLHGNDTNGAFTTTVPQQ